MTTEKLHSLHESTSLQFDDSAARQAAIDHFKQFTRQHDLFVKDYNELVKLGSLHDLILKRQSEYQKDKFNFIRWKETFSKDAFLHGDVSRLRELATTGSTLGIPTDFIPLYHPPPMRGQYKYLGNTYTAHIQSLLKKGCIIVLPLKAIDEFDLKVNFTTSAWWAPKANKPEGRFCIDPTNAPNHYIGLNTPETLQTAIDKYVATNLPTLQSLITHQIIDVAHKFKCPVSELMLYKSDFKSAFYSTIVNPSDATLLGTRISDTEFMLHISGSFGLNSQPVVFGLLGRNFNYKLQQVISGSTDIYIDDTCGSTRDDLVDHDIQQIINTAIATIGDDSINFEKLEKGKTLDMIGWSISVLTSTVRPSDKAIKKLFYTFFVKVKDSFQSLTFHLRQQLYSYVERYSQGILGTRPFLNTFIKALQSQNKHQDSLLRMDSSMKQAIFYWRIIIIILISDPNLLNTPFEHFRLISKNEYSLTFITDSFTSIGIQCLDVNDNPLGCTSYRFPFDANEPDFQNMKEFTAVILTIYIAKKRFKLPRGSNLKLISNSSTFISWIIKNKSKSNFAERAFLLYTWATIITGYAFTNILHSPGAGEVIRDSDILSRDSNYRPTKFQYWDFRADDHIRQLIAFCDPFKPIDNTFDLTVEAINLTSSLLS